MEHELVGPVDERNARREGFFPKLQAGIGVECAKIIVHRRAGAPRCPSGLAFLGLIPTGVGLAYLIFYRVESGKLLS